MSTEEKKLNLYEKLAKIRQNVSVLRKNASGYGYKYTTEDEILAKVTAGMDQYGVSLIPMIRSGTGVVTPYKYVDKKGKDAYEIIVNAEMVFRWVNDENPEDHIDIDWLMIGQQSDAAQAMGAGLTYTNRYFLLKYFQIATVEDDPDKYRSKKRAAIDTATQSELKKAVKEARELANNKVKAGVDSNEVSSVIQKYVGVGKNLSAIEDIATAQKVADAIRKLGGTK